MTDEAIRTLLAGADPALMIPVPPGMVAILVERVDEDGGDLAAVGEWVAAHGGYSGQTDPLTSQAMRPGRIIARTDPGARYYAVPVEALKP